jgi:hypothetical protein
MTRTVGSILPKKVEIRWPSGIVQTLENVRGDQILQVDEPSAGKAPGD